MQLEKPTKEFISKVLYQYSQEEGNELNESVLKLFRTFNDDKNKYNVLIKVAALNKIYSTAITNVNPVVEKIIEINGKDNVLNELNDYVNLVDKISKIEWTNSKGNNFKRNNLSFASKYVHFLSEYKTPIYDSYIWIVIKGYLGQKNNTKISFKNPASFKEFYATFDRFKQELNLEQYSNYQLDKFLWQYGKKLITDIEKELDINLDKSKSELRKRIKASIKQRI